MPAAMVYSYTWQEVRVFIPFGAWQTVQSFSEKKKAALNAAFGQVKHLLKPCFQEMGRRFLSLLCLPIASH